MWGCADARDDIIRFLANDPASPATDICRQLYRQDLTFSAREHKLAYWKYYWLFRVASRTQAVLRGPHDYTDMHDRHG